LPATANAPKQKLLPQQLRQGQWWWQQNCWVVVSVPVILLLLFAIALFLAIAFFAPSPSLLRSSQLPASLPTIILAAFAAHVTNQEGPVQCRASFQRPANGMCWHGRAAVGIRVPGIIIHANQRRQPQRRANGGCGHVGNAATK
jgi:hypothetical protein